MSKWGTNLNISALACMSRNSSGIRHTVVFLDFLDAFMTGLIEFPPSLTTLRSIGSLTDVFRYLIAGNQAIAGFRFYVCFRFWVFQHSVETFGIMAFLSDRSCRVHKLEVVVGSD
jgi:hypothetical protein